MKKCCPRSTPMKQNLHDKAFVPFVCLVGTPLLPNLYASWWEITAQKKSSQNATNLAHRIPEQRYGVRLSIFDTVLFRRSNAISKLTSSRSRELYRE